MFESFPKDVLGWSSIVLLILLILKFVLDGKGKDRRGGDLHMQQGGTVPIVVPPPPTVGRSGTDLDMTLHAAVDDDPGDTYWVEAFRIRPKWKGMVAGPGGTKVRAPVEWEITNFDIDGQKIDGLKDGRYLREHKLEKDVVSGKIKALVEVPLATATDFDMVTFAMYRANGTRSSIVTAEIMKSN